jgi:hypothetical protein
LIYKGDNEDVDGYDNLHNQFLNFNRLEQIDNARSSFVDFYIDMENEQLAEN